MRLKTITRDKSRNSILKSNERTSCYFPNSSIAFLLISSFATYLLPRMFRWLLSANIKSLPTLIVQDELEQKILRIFSMNVLPVFRDIASKIGKYLAYAAL